MNDFNAKFSKRFILLFPVLFALVLCACRKEENPAAPVSPFSDSTWEYTAEDVLAYEGSSPRPTIPYMEASAILIPKLIRNAREQSNICLMTKNA